MNTEVIRANIKVHSAMAATYNENEPHYRPENRAKVRKELEAMSRRHPGGALLDLGCGTGFVIDLAKDLFRTIDGIDVTPAMLARVDVSGGNITVHNVAAEKLPFQDGSFDVVSSYAFLHHLEDLRAVLLEAHRVLKQGGEMYIDLEPNKLFWAAITVASELTASGRVAVSDIVSREILSVLHTDERVAREFAITEDTFNKAEFTKSILGGIDPFEFQDVARDIGFSACDTSFEWFLAQGTVMHGDSFERADYILAFLRRALPVSAPMFKYLKFVLRK